MVWPQAQTRQPALGCWWYLTSSGCSSVLCVSCCARLWKRSCGSYVQSGRWISAGMMVHWTDISLLQIMSKRWPAAGSMTALRTRKILNSPGPLRYVGLPWASSPKTEKKICVSSVWETRIGVSTLLGISATRYDDWAHYERYCCKGEIGQITHPGNVEWRTKWSSSPIRPWRSSMSISPSPPPAALPLNNAGCSLPGYKCGSGGRIPSWVIRNLCVDAISLPSRGERVIRFWTR